MILDLLPPYPVGTAITAAMLIPVMLLVLGRAFPRLALGRRFWYAITLTALLWSGGLFVHYPGLHHLIAILPDIVAGLLFYMTAVFGIFSAWGLLAYGYTVSVLDAAARFGEEFDRKSWLRMYGAGHGLEGFFEDRLLVLTGFRLVEIHGPEIRLRGRYAAKFGKIVLWCMKLFNVPAFKK